MIDLHTHIIPNVDDGSKSIEDTFELLKEAARVGFTDVILTPHYIKGYYETDTKIREYWVESIARVLEELKIPIKVHVGNEIYVCEDIDELVYQNIVSTLNNSKYVLVELPMNNNIKYLEEVIFKLSNLDKVPIIAHPERYSYFQKDIKILIELHNKGVLFQSNYGSILGLYGEEPKKALTKMLKENIIDFLGTDVHRPDTIYQLVEDSKKKIKKIIGEKELEKLTTFNAEKMILNI